MEKWSESTHFSVPYSVIHYIILVWAIAYEGHQSVKFCTTSKTMKTGRVLIIGPENELWPSSNVSFFLFLSLSLSLSANSFAVPNISISELAIESRSYW